MCKDTVLRWEKKTSACMVAAVRKWNGGMQSRLASLDGSRGNFRFGVYMLSGDATNSTVMHGSKVKNSQVEALYCFDCFGEEQQRFQTWSAWCDLQVVAGP